LGIALGIVAERARRQRVAVQALAARGAAVFYEHDHDGQIGMKFHNPLASTPTWLDRLVGPDFFHNVVSVYVGYGNLREERDQRSLFQSPDLRRVLSTEDLKPLKDLPRLETLAIRDEASSDGLSLLADLPKLDKLSIKGSQANAPELKLLRQRRPKLTLYLQ